MTWQDHTFLGGLFVLLILCALQGGVWIGRWLERRRWRDAALLHHAIDVGESRYFAVHPSDMDQYKRAMRFMQSDRPTTARARGLPEPPT